MERKTKTAAICFFGQARVLDICYPYLKKNLLNPLGKNGKDYDIFCCVEDDEDAYKVNLLKPTKVLKIKSKDAEKILKKDADFLNKHNYKKFISRISSRTPNVFLNMLQQVYKKKLCYNLLKEHIDKYNSKYKYFIRARFDTLFIDKFNFKKINVEKDELIVTKNRILEGSGGIDDSFCIISDLDTFRVYCGVIDNLKKLIFKHHLISFSFLEKIYFSFEKKYKNILIKLLKDKRYFNTAFEFLTLIPNGLFYKSMRKDMFGNHPLLLEQMEDHGRKIKYLKLNHAIIRKDRTGILEIP